jgi:molybdate transport system permease protein
MNESVWETLAITLRVAFGATLLALPLAVALGYLLARREFRGKALVETLVALPLVLPPTAVGYLLLKLLGRSGWLGSERLGFDPGILFTWKGAILAAAVMSLPLMARTARVAFEAVPVRLELMGASLGFSRLAVWRRITLPLAGRGLLAALFLGFARATGEFGATVVVAGNIPGETQTLSLAIFSDLQAHRDEHAWFLVAITVLFSFVLVWLVEFLSRRRGA